MIKLIATDLDGTLLDERRRLPKEIFPLIDELSARGILFAPASGRQYANLEALFAPVKDKALFLCENGALVKFRGETLLLEPVRDELVLHALSVIRSVPRLHPLLCGARCAYLDETAEPFSSLSFASYTECRRVDRLEEVVGREPVCKIAVFDDAGAAENCIKALPARLPALRTTLSGAEWCDVSSPNANKGEAIVRIQSIFGLKREECAAFGDHMNDYEMLLNCGMAFVPENGYPPLVRLIGRTVPSNAEGGVIKAIKKILSGREL